MEKALPAYQAFPYKRRAKIRARRFPRLPTPTPTLLPRLFLLSPQFSLFVRTGTIAPSAFPASQEYKWALANLREKFNKKMLVVYNELQATHPGGVTIIFYSGRYSIFLERGGGGGGFELKEV